MGLPRQLKSLSACGEILTLQGWGSKPAQQSPIHHLSPTIHPRVSNANRRRAFAAYCRTFSSCFCPFSKIIGWFEDLRHPKEYPPAHSLWHCDSDYHQSQCRKVVGRRQVSPVTRMRTERITWFLRPCPASLAPADGPSQDMPTLSIAPLSSTYDEPSARIIARTPIQILV